MAFTNRNKTNYTTSFQSKIDLILPNAYSIVLENTSRTKIRRNKLITNFGIKIVHAMLPGTNYDGSLCCHFWMKFKQIDCENQKNNQSPCREERKKFIRRKNLFVIFFGSSSAHFSKDILTFKKQFLVRRLVAKTGLEHFKMHQQI